MSDDARSSAGFGGGVPAGSTNKFGSSGDRVIACCKVALPVSMLLRPLRGPMPRALWTPGRRKSASIKRTFTPFCASTIEQLILVVVFPSCGSALVMRIIFGGAPSEESKREVRSARYDSAIWDCGRDFVTNSTDSFEDATISRFSFLPSTPVLEP